MAAKKRKPREPRPNQFGITLGEKYAELLRANAGELNESPTTLGGRLLEKALAERETSLEEGSKAVDGKEGLLKELRTLRKELVALRKMHHNATVKLLNLSGMSAAEVTAWAKRHLDE